MCRRWVVCGRLQGSRSIRWAARTGSFLAHRSRGSPDEERGQRLHPVQGSLSLAVSRWLWERSKRIAKTAFRVKWLCSNSFFFVYQTRSLDFRRGLTVHARMRLGADHLRDDGDQGAVQAAQDEHHPKRWHRGDDGELGIRSVRSIGQDVPQEKPGNKEMKPRTIFFSRTRIFHAIWCWKRKHTRKNIGIRVPWILSTHRNIRCSHVHA